MWGRLRIAVAPSVSGSEGDGRRLRRSSRPSRGSTLRTTTPIVTSSTCTPSCRSGTGQRSITTRRWRSVRRRAHAHFNWGALLLRRERFAEAAQVFTRVLELDPEDAPAHVRLGQALEKQGATREAAKHYRRAIDIDPGNREARYLIGLRLLAEGKPDAAVGHLERTLSPIDARTPRFMRQLGLAHARAGNREMAIHHLREASRLAEAGRQAQMVARIAADLRELDRTSTERR